MGGSLAWQFWKFVRQPGIPCIGYWPHNYLASMGGVTYAPAVIARVNLLGKAEPSILTFTDQHGHEIGDYP